MSAAMWTMRDGTKIKVRDMTNSHLANALRMLERNAERHLAALAMCGNPFDGDGARDAFDDMFDGLLEMDSCELASTVWGAAYVRLETEALRRGLDW